MGESDSVPVYEKIRYLLLSVRLILDAEESYYEAALDGYVRLLSMKYNRPYTPDNHLDKPSSPWTGPVI